VPKVDQPDSILSEAEERGKAGCADLVGPRTQPQIWRLADDLLGNPEPAASRDTPEGHAPGTPEARTPCDPLFGLAADKLHALAYCSRYPSQ
jgi:hypothetical protein